MKGKSNVIEVFRPSTADVRGETVIYRSRYNVSNITQYSEIKRIIASMVHGKGLAKGDIISVEGNHWFGSTHFAREVMNQVQNVVYIVAATGVKYEETELMVWQALMARMTRECHLLHGDTEGFKDSLWRFFKDTMFKKDANDKTEELTKFIWVANPLFGTNFPKPPNAESMPQSERMDYLLKIVMHFIKQVSKYAPLLLVICKHQYMSSEDWFVTNFVCQQVWLYFFLFRFLIRFLFRFLSHFLFHFLSHFL